MTRGAPLRHGAAAHEPWPSRPVTDGARGGPFPLEWPWRQCAARPGAGRVPAAPSGAQAAASRPPGLSFLAAGRAWTMITSTSGVGFLCGGLGGERH